MKALINVKPSPEQLALFSRSSEGVEVILGAAGSGKTTTALLKLRSAAGFYLNREKKRPTPGSVNILVLTFNRTLRGYIAELTKRQFANEPLVNLDFYTFNKWAQHLTGAQSIINITRTEGHLKSLAHRMKMDADFVVDEAVYVLGRFESDKLDDYLTARRDGRGITPRMERPARQRLLDEVIRPYIEMKRAKRLVDWNDLRHLRSGQCAAHLQPKLYLERGRCDPAARKKQQTTDQLSKYPRNCPVCQRYAHRPDAGRQWHHARFWERPI